MPRRPRNKKSPGWMNTFSNNTFLNRVVCENTNKSPSSHLFTCPCPTPITSPPSPLPHARIIRVHQESFWMCTTCTFTIKNHNIIVYQMTSITLNRCQLYCYHLNGKKSRHPYILTAFHTSPNTCSHILHVHIYRRKHPPCMGWMVAEGCVVWLFLNLSIFTAQLTASATPQPYPIGRHWANTMNVTHNIDDMRRKPSMLNALNLPCWQRVCKCWKYIRELHLSNDIVSS